MGPVFLVFVGLFFRSKEHVCMKYLFFFINPGEFDAEDSLEQNFFEDVNTSQKQNAGDNSLCAEFLYWVPLCFDFISEIGGG